MADFDTSLSSINPAHPLASFVLGGFNARQESAGNSMENVVTSAIRTFTDSFVKNADGSVSGTGSGDPIGDDNRTTIASVPGDAFERSMLFFLDVDIETPTSGNSSAWFLHMPNSRTGGTHWTFQRDNFGTTLRIEKRSNFNTEKTWESSGYGGRAQYLMHFDHVTRVTTLYQNGSVISTLTFSDGGNDDYGWYSARIGIGGPNDKYYSSLLLSNTAQFSSEDINGLISDPYDLFGSEGGGETTYDFSGSIGAEVSLNSNTFKTVDHLGSVPSSVGVSSDAQKQNSFNGSNASTVDVSSNAQKRNAFNGSNASTVGVSSSTQKTVEVSGSVGINVSLQAFFNVVDENQELHIFTGSVGLIASSSASMIKVADHSGTFTGNVDNNSLFNKISTAEGTLSGLTDVAGTSQKTATKHANLTFSEQFSAFYVKSVEVSGVLHSTINVGARFVDVSGFADHIVAKFDGVIVENQFIGKIMYSTFDGELPSIAFKGEL